MTNNKSQLLALVGNNIRARRNALGFTQVQLGVEADIDSSYVNRVEKGTANLSVLKLEALSKALKCAAHELLQDNNLEI